MVTYDEMMDFLSKNKNAVRLKFPLCDFTEWDDSEIKEWSEALKKMSSVENFALEGDDEDEFVLGECAITGKVMLALAEVLPKMPKLSELAFNRVHCSDEEEDPSIFRKELLNVLHTMKNLISIALVSADIFYYDRKELQELMNSISKLPNLKSLDLSCNDFRPWDGKYSRVPILTEFMPKLTKLSSLTFQRNSILSWSRKFIREFGNALVQLPNLEILDLGFGGLSSSKENAPPSNNFIDFVSFLSKMKRLTTLNIGKNAYKKMAQENRLSTFLAGVAKIPNLTDLDLTGIRYPSCKNDFIYSIINSISKVQSLTKLNLKETDFNVASVFDSENMRALAIALSEMPNLSVLNLPSSPLVSWKQSVFDEFVQLLGKSRSIQYVVDCGSENSFTINKRKKKLYNIGRGNQRLMQFTAADCLYQVHTQLKKLSSPLPTEIIQNILSFSGNMKVTKEGFAAIRNKHSIKKEVPLPLPETDDRSIKKRRV